jgi:hypothetical protein
MSEGNAYLLKGSIVRVSQLFGEELDFMIQFVVAHLTATPEDVSAVNFNYLFRQIICSDSAFNEDSKQLECFTIMERLSILKKMNTRLRTIPQIYTSEEYWDLVKLGLGHIDQGPRKTALNILKENLSQSINSRQISEINEFEQLWTTFFDIMDTLESFSSHLVKAVWKRVDLFYDFILKYKQCYA